MGPTKIYKDVVEQYRRASEREFAARMALEAAEKALVPLRKALVATVAFSKKGETITLSAPNGDVFKLKKNRHYCFNITQVGTKNKWTDVIYSVNDLRHNIALGVREF